MTTRRGLFKLLAGALASPALAPLAKLVPESRFGGLIPGHDYYYFSQALLGHLKKNTPMKAICQTRSLPPRSGNPIKFFTYTPEPASEQHT